MSIDADTYATALRDVLDRTAATQRTAVAAAADLIAASLRDGGVLQVFGTGHSEALAMELAGRAGGLVPTNKTALRDLVLLGGHDPAILNGPELERDPAYARELYDLTGARPGDAFAIASQSGINGSVVELALTAAEHGHPVIAFTSVEHSTRAPARHPSGKRLLDIADVVLDNGAPYGDALLPLPDGGAVCAASSITAAMLAQMVVAEVVRRQLDRGDTPQVYLSANIPEGDVHNTTLESRYAGRIRRTA